MRKEEKKCKASKVLMFAGGAVLTVVGFMVIPPLIEKYSNKIYKAALKKEEIDFDSMGPEIVRKEKTEGE